MAQYVVKSGDTLNKIAASLGYSSYTQVPGLSGYDTSNPNLIKVGQVLTYGEPAPTSSSPTLKDYSIASATGNLSPEGVINPNPVYTGGSTREIRAARARQAAAQAAAQQQAAAQAAAQQEAARLAALEKAKVPETATDINQANKTIIPEPKIVPSEISSARATTEASRATTADIQKQIDDARAAEQARLLAEQKTQNAANKTFLENLFATQKTEEQITAAKQAEFGVDTQEYLTKKKGYEAQVASLVRDHDKMKADLEAQIAETQGRYTTTNFANNRIAQMNANAAPKLNSLAAEINYQSALLESLNGNFNQAQSFIQKAVDNVLASQKSKLDQATLLYNENQDNFEKVSKIYSDAYSAKLTTMSDELKKKEAEMLKVGELGYQNPDAGILITDTLLEAMDKIAKSGGTAQYQLDLEKERRLGTKDGAGLTVAQNEDLAQDLAYLASDEIKSREQAEAWLNKMSTAIQTKYNAGAIQTFRNEINRLYPQAPLPGQTISTAPQQPVVGGLVGNIINTTAENYTPERGLVGAAAKGITDFFKGLW